MRVTVLVNGRREEVRTERDTALLYVLRNHLGLTGTRFGCGLGLCGACLVLIDGRPACVASTRITRSCANAQVANRTASRNIPRTIPHLAVYPPSIAITAPVKKLARSLAIYVKNFATSSAVAIRPIG